MTVTPNTINPQYLAETSQEKQLLVNIVDNLAATKPDAAYAYLPVSPNGYEEGFKKLSYKQFANAVNGLAWWLTAELGKGNLLQTLIYTGPNDILQNATILACAKAGYKVRSLTYFDAATFKY